MKGGWGKGFPMSGGCSASPELVPGRAPQGGLKDKRKPQNRDPALEENRKLKKLVAEQLLIIEGQKKLYQLEGEGS